MFYLSVFLVPEARVNSRRYFNPTTADGSYARIIPYRTGAELVDKLSALADELSIFVVYEKVQDDAAAAVGACVEAGKKLPDFQFNSYDLDYLDVEETLLNPDAELIHAWLDSVPIRLNHAQSDEIAQAYGRELVAFIERQPETFIDSYLPPELNELSPEGLIAHWDALTSDEAQTRSQKRKRLAKYALNSSSDSEVRQETNEVTVSVWERITNWTRPWTIAVPVAAALVLGLSVLLIGLRPDLHGQINTEYADMIANKTPEMSETIQRLPLPWENAVLGFNESIPGAAGQALGAGLWAGKMALIKTKSARTPHPGLLPEWIESNWAETKWADYYNLGRWFVLLWALAKTDHPEINWKSQQTILDTLLTTFAKRPPSEIEAKQVLTELEGIKPLLTEVQMAKNIPARLALSGELEMSMQALATIL